MNPEELVSDDPGTILASYESYPRAVPVHVGNVAAEQARSPHPHFEELPYKSPYRWTAPRIVICDDGSLDKGEEFYVRSDRIVIGRTHGDIVIGHDTAMSSGHAEISRRSAGGKHAWVLRDLGSSNGTLARVNSVTLKPGMRIQLGSIRYRFELPGADLGAASAHSPTHDTAMVAHVRSTPDDLFPALVENMAGAERQIRHPLRGPTVTIGRPRFGNLIEIDDPCVAAAHAVVNRDESGAWQLEALPSVNGVWVHVDAISLKKNCHFQCGEQRFWFRL